MSTLRVTKIVDRLGTGPVEFTKGATLPVGQTIVDSSGVSAIEISTVTGVVTATSFSGDGSGVTGLSGTPKGQAIALIFLG
jgi:hypothetical protein